MSLHQRNKGIMSLLLLDLDRFKEVNDLKGHFVGDEVLVEVANILQSSMRTSDIVARWGGEEFVLLLTDANLQSAVTIAEKIRLKVEQSDKIHKLASKSVTVSIGVSECDLKLALSENLKVADNHMYAAKQQGRNKTISM
jgi:two-component system cell cycle response regulator